MANFQASRTKPYDQAQNTVPYKLELYQRGLNSPRASFYFIINPQNYNIIEKDRIGATKTYGGTWVENFGPDDKQISLSGDFGQSTQSGGWDGTIKQILGARAALKYLRENFIRLAEKAIDEGKPTNTYYLKFYDLSSIENYHEGWLVKIDNFKVERDKSAPFNYRWNITMTAYGKKFMDLPAFDIAGNPKFLAKFKNFVKNKFKKFTLNTNGPTIGTWSDNSLFGQEINKLRNNIERYLLAPQNYLAAVNDVINEINAIPAEVGDAAQELAARAGNLKIAAEKVISDIEKFPQSFINVKNEVVESINLLAQLSGAFVLDLASNITDWGNSGYINTGEQAGLELRNTELNNAMSVLENKPTNIAGSQIIKLTQSEEDQILNDNDDAATPTTLQTFNRVRLVPQADIPLNLSLPEIAETFLGSADSSDDIASVNPSIDWENREAGQVVYIPVIVTIDDVSASGNNVFDIDFMGSDIKQDDNGFLVVNAKEDDVATVSNFSNLQQSLTRRLDTEVSTLLSDDQYGLKISTYIGQVSNQTIRTLVQTGLVSALLKDPRVSKVTNIEFAETGADGFKADITIVPINKDQFKFTIPLSNNTSITKIFTG